MFVPAVVETTDRSRRRRSKRRAGSAADPSGWDRARDCRGRSAGAGRGELNKQPVKIGAKNPRELMTDVIHASL
jgi:hypothetical protein